MQISIRALLTGLLCFCAWGTAWAQFDQYTSPGGPEGRPEDAKGRLAREVAEARYHLGLVHIAPEVGLKDVAYVKTLLATGSTAAPADLTATVDAGFKFYLPASSKVTWTAEALPEYVWWHKRTDSRRLNENFAVGFHAFWNKLTLEVAAARSEAQRILTPELPQLTNTRLDHADLNAELGLSRRFSLFAEAQAFEQTSLADRADPLSGLFELLDRREQIARGGVRWRPFEGLAMGVGAERSQVDFTLRRTGEPDRSNYGTAPIFEGVYEHGRIFFQTDLAARSLRAAHGADFVAYDKVTGKATASYRTAAGPELFIYGHRELIYSTFIDYPYLDDERVGAALHLRLGHRTRGSVYIEGGTDGYTPLGAGVLPRKDDVTSYGGALQFELGHSASLRLEGVHSRYRSNLPGADRTFSSLGFTIALTGIP
ncbi:MAG TPA: hypothetical protein VMM92_01260 [Thermoanaerobaculia bacterium]|nr:hypothetical protein [Thermoanaerobaculia bacterium]